jgi:hypothetical protein
MLMQAAPTDDTAPSPLLGFKVETKHGTTAADALAFVKLARRIYVAVPFAGPSHDWDYFAVSKKETLSKLSALKPDQRFTSLCKDYSHRGNARWVTVWLGSTYSDEPAPAEKAVP